MKTEAKRTLPRNEVKAIVFNSYRERNTERRNLGSALKHTHPHSRFFKTGKREKREDIEGIMVQNKMSFGTLPRWTALFSKTWARKRD